MSVSSDPTPAPQASSGEAGAPSAEANRAEAPPAEAPLQEEHRAEPQATASVLPVPIGPLRSQLTPAREEQARPSFWRRIKMRRRDSGTVGTGSEADTSARLTAIERELEKFDANLQAQFETLNARLDEVWESEEQLSQLADIQEKLDKLVEVQSSLSRSLTGMKRSLGWLAVLVGVAVIGAGFALNLIT